MLVRRETTLRKRAKKAHTTLQRSRAVRELEHLPMRFVTEKDGTIVAAEYSDYHTLKTKRKKKSATCGAVIRVSAATRT